MQTNKNAAYCLGDNAATARNFYVIHNKSITQKRAKLNLDPLSIFENEDYPTFEEWQAEYMPNSKCPICGSHANFRYREMGDNYRIYVDCDNGHSTTDIFKKLGIDLISGVYVSTPPKQEKENPGYNKQEKAKAGTLKLTDLSKVKMKAIEFILPPYIYKNNVNLIHAGTSSAKSLLTLTLCAKISQGGGELPHLNFIAGGKVLYVNTEDTVSDAFFPRLRAAGYNPDNFHLLDGINQRFEYDHPDLENFVKVGSYDVVVFDILKDILKDGQDINNSKDVRAAINHLKRLAEKYNVAVIVLHHNNKSNSASGNGRVQGSNDWYSACRSVLELQKDKETGVVNVYHNKSNHAKEETGFAFSIEGVELGLDARGKMVKAPAIKFCTMTKSREEMENEFAGKEENKQDKAESLILKCLQEAEGVGMWSQLLEQAVTAMGISNITYRRARKALQDKKFIRKGQADGKTYWYIVE